jgi:hypothetical protein
VSIPDVAASAPFTLDLIKPSLLSFLNTLPFLIAASSSPSEAKKKHVIGILVYLLIFMFITEIIHKNDFFN